MGWPTDVPRTYYWGRKWDAPLTDEAELMPREWVGGTCQLCNEPITTEDNVLYMPFTRGHLECVIRSGMGDVQHLEGRCLCFRGSGNEIVKDSDHYPTYRESSRATIQWLLDNHRGRFHD